MKYNQAISFFMPAYNEEKNIGPAIQDALIFLKNNFKDYELIIVDDGSKDKTGKIADVYARKNKKMRVIHHPTNLQYGVALKSGFENSKKELIFYTDSDRQFDLNEIHQLMKYINDYDIVIGYRKKRKDKKMRVIYSSLYNLTLRLLLKIPYKDIDCAFKLCKKKVIDKIKPLTTIRSADVQLLSKTLAYNFKIKQIPVTHYPRRQGVSEAESGGSFFVRIKPNIIRDLIKETLYLKKQINKIKK